MEIEHWMMFGTFAQQRHFIYPTSDTYTGVIIQGNMAAHAADGLAAFVMQKTKRSYLIDPMTHAFQHNPEHVLDKTGEVRSSIKKMADWYDPEKKHVAKLLGDSALRPEHLKDKGMLEEFVANCIQFQMEAISKAMRFDEVFKYFEEDVDLHPRALVAPYFYLTEINYGDWLPLQREAAVMAKKLAADRKLYGGIVVSDGLLRSERDRQEVAKVMRDCPLDGYLLWIDDFDETSEGTTGLSTMLSFCRELRQNEDRDLINLHGGYFSILAAGVAGRGAMSGVTHGPEFGEYRSVVPVGGGIPIARYYVPKLHARIRYREAASLFSRAHWLDSAKAFHSNVCDCKACVTTLAGDPARFVLFGQGNPKPVRRKSGTVTIDFPTSESTLRCLEHYLQRKKIEFSNSCSKTSDELIGELHSGWNEYSTKIGDGADHLKAWETVFLEDSKAG